LGERLSLSLSSFVSRLPSSFLEKAFPFPQGGEGGEGAPRYWLDLGCDTGSFVRGVARRHPDLRVIGLELRAHAVAFARARAQQQRLQNAAFLQARLGGEERRDVWRLLWLYCSGLLWEH